MRTNDMSLWTERGGGMTEVEGKTGSSHWAMGNPAVGIRPRVGHYEEILPHMDLGISICYNSHKTFESELQKILHEKITMSTNCM